MGKTKIDESVRQSIEDQNIDLINPNHITVEDEMTKQAHDFLPECYTLNDTENDGDFCTGEDFCCTFQNEVSDMDFVNSLTQANTPITKLKTIHEVNDSLRNDLKSRLNDEQISQLNQAKFIILESDNSLDPNRLQTIPASEMAQRGIQEVSICGSKVDDAPLQARADLPYGDIIDEELCSVAVIHRPEDEPDEIGLNKFEAKADGTVEIMRSFEYLPVDNIAYLAAALQHHVREDDALSDEDDTDDDISEDNRDKRRNDVCAESSELNDASSESSSGSASPLNAISDISFEWLDNINNVTPTDNTSDKGDDFCLPIFGTRRTKRPRPVSSDDESKGSDGDDAKLTQRQKVVIGQREDPDTKTIIECVQLGKKPEYHEIRQESPYLNAIMEEFETLAIVNGELRKNSLDEKGDTISLLVVPEKLAKEVIMTLHVNMAHSHCWRLSKIISGLYFIPRLNILLREVYKSCVSCLLSQAPTIQKARKITVSDSVPTRELNVDLLHLPPAHGWNYALIACDVASSYVFARKLRTKTSKEAAMALLDILYSNSFLCQYVSSDMGNEFLKDFTKICTATAATHLINSVLYKNANKSETANSRIVNLFRRMLVKETDWPNQLQKCAFSLNCSSMNFNGYVTSPSQLFNNRCLTGVPSLDQDVEKSVVNAGKSVRELMTQVSKHRLADTPSLAHHISNRPHVYYVGEKCLIWAERILAKKLLKSGILKIKLSKFWRIGTVTKALGQHYMVKTEDGKLRHVHRRQMKPYPDSAP